MCVFGRCLFLLVCVSVFLFQPTPFFCLSLRWQCVSNTSFGCLPRVCFVWICGRLGGCVCGVCVVVPCVNVVYWCVPDSWVCTECKFKNAAERRTCRACTTSAKRWQCVRCTTFNSQSLWYCAVCRSDKLVEPQRQVVPEQARAVAAAQGELAVGERILAKWNKRTFYKAKITAVNSNGFVWTVMCVSRAVVSRP